MNERFFRVARWTASHHGVISTSDLDAFGVGSSLRHQWLAGHLLERLGPRSFCCPSGEPTWARSLAAAVADLDGAGLVAGRSASRLHRLDEFGESAPELITPRQHRNRRSIVVVRSTNRPFLPGDIVTVNGFRIIGALRTLLDSLLFGFSREETENAVDSAIRLRLVSEQRLRTQVIAQHHQRLNGNSMLLETLVDTGGQSQLERRLLALLRGASIARPMTQKIFRDRTRTVARVDAFFPGNLVIEVSGHGAHATRQQRQIDARRHTELTVRGLVVLTFTYEDVMYRPRRVAEQIRMAVRAAA